MLDTMMESHTGLMDIYLLRRFLDKKYIKTVVAYTGAAHSVNYIKYLVKIYDFKITHSAYTNTKMSIEKLQNCIKFKKCNLNLENIFIQGTKSNKYIQCTNISKFPEHFN
jgi:hypothetical protein